ncbi:hypothetical protein D3C87_1686200 [compost metagenome]
MSFAGARIWPLARASLYFFARDRKPIAGLASNNLMKPAVVVQISNQTAGNMVTQT